MTNDYEPLNIAHGMDVVGADDQKVGSVADMRGDYIVVSKGFFFPTDYYIPIGAINTADRTTVYLNVTKDQALHQGWDVEPFGSEPAPADQPIVDAGLNVQNPVDQESGGFIEVDDVATLEQDAAATDVDTSETVTVPLTEEELTARTHEVDRGGVRVDKVVTTEEQVIDVPVTEEHLHVTRRVVDRDVDSGEVTFEESSFEVPLHAEEVEVEKRARVREEVEITKHATTETQQVRDTVRREDVEVTDEGGVVIDETERVVDDKGRPII